MKPRDIETAVERRAKAAPPEDRFVRLKVVLATCGLSRTSMYDAIRKGEFPAPVKLNGRSSAWVMSEIQHWLRSCIKASRDKSNRAPDPRDAPDK